MADRVGESCFRLRRRVGLLALRRLFRMYARTGTQTSQDALWHRA